jgi:hypothetical protein
VEQQLSYTQSRFVSMLPLSCLCCSNAYKRRPLNYRYVQTEHNGCMPVERELRQRVNSQLPSQCEDRVVQTHATTAVLVTTCHIHHALDPCQSLRAAQFVLLDSDQPSEASLHIEKAWKKLTLTCSRFSRLLAQAFPWVLLPDERHFIT